ncbi:hypothetical protein ACQPYK_24965 [Streptosporangium sp. CA-135522]|uniref:hypothetical protein n=1 Tax=Streptosporangium sp. CA-135522 TaxID=3240072 RepID=UPI003D944773
MDGEAFDAHRLHLLSGRGGAGCDPIVERPVQLAGGIARAFGEAGQPGQQRLVDGAVQSFDLALAVRLAGRQPQHLHAQGGQRLAHRGGGELQAAVDAHQGWDRAERAALGVAHQRHPQRGQHRAGVRRQRERPPEQGAGTVVDDRRQPRAHRRAARR